MIQERALIISEFRNKEKKEEKKSINLKKIKKIKLPVLKIFIKNNN